LVESGEKAIGEIWKSCLTGERKRGLKNLGYPYQRRPPLKLRVYLFN